MQPCDSEARGLPQIELLPAERRSAARNAWARVEARATAVPLACSWNWIDSWLEQFGDVVRHDFAIGWRGSKPIGAALLTRGRTRQSRVWLRTLHLGTAGEPAGSSIYVQRNGLLAAPGERAVFARALVERLAGERGFDQLRLDGFDPECAADFAAADASLRVSTLPCPTVDLRAAAAHGDEVLALLSPNTRYQVRRSLRGYGPVTVDWAATTDVGLEIFEELVSLHQRRWRAVGEPGAFASERQLEFHRRLIARLMPERRALLFRVRDADGTIGCLYSHLDGDAVLSYQLGLAQSSDNKIKPGFVAHALCMQACFDRGFVLYDFLSGGGSYKRELATGERPLVWASGLRRGPSVVVADALQRVRGALAPAARA
jgi:CelD/BcsL family acetyltransferase involved in cellulose biosynthesis